MTDQNPARTSVIYVGDTGDARDTAPAGPRRGRRLLGPAVFVAVLLLAVIEGVAVGAGATGDYPRATTLAWVVIVGTVCTFLLGVLAVVAGRGRWWGLAAAVLSVLVNPFTLMQILDFFGTVASSS
jgi:K+-sensing histidine kinase KdpD